MDLSLDRYSAMSLESLISPINNPIIVTSSDNAVCMDDGVPDHPMTWPEQWIYVARPWAK
jgi:hypothetical protein